MIGSATPEKAMMNATSGSRINFAGNIRHSLSSPFRPDCFHRVEDRQAIKNTAFNENCGGKPANAKGESTASVNIFLAAQDCVDFALENGNGIA
jgi:hypothetical protein